MLYSEHWLICKNRLENDLAITTTQSLQDSYKRQKIWCDEDLFVFQIIKTWDLYKNFCWRTWIL